MDINFGLDKDLINSVKSITEASCASKKVKTEDLTGNQVKLDMNKNGKLDAADFKKLRKDESQSTQKSLGKRAGDLSYALAGTNSDAGLTHKDYSTSRHQVRKLRKSIAATHGKDTAKRAFDAADDDYGAQYSSTAGDTSRKKEFIKKDLGGKKSKEYKTYNHIMKKNEFEENYKEEEKTLEDFSLDELEDFMVSEDFEQLDELSKGTLGSYVKKASIAGAVAYGNHMDKRAKSAEADILLNRHMSFSDKDDIRKKLGVDSRSVEKPREVAGKRIAGIAKAVNKLTKEQYEEYLNELSPETLGSYVKNASRNARINSIIATDFKAREKAARKPSKKKAWDTLAWDHSRKAWKREDGVNLASDKLVRSSWAQRNAPKLTKEQIEEIETLAAKYGLGE